MGIFDFFKNKDKKESEEFIEDIVFKTEKQESKRNNLKNIKDFLTDYVDEKNLNKVWEKDLHISPAGNISLLIDAEKQENYELDNFYYEKEPYTGIAYFYFDDEKKIENEFNVVNGIKHGISKVFRKDGTISSIITYEDGLKNGAELGFFRSGKMQYELFWKKNVKEGKETHFYENGYIDFEVDSFKSNKENGLKTQYFENGEMESKIKYQNGMKNGKFLLYHNNGSIKCRGAFTDDKESGEWFLFDEHGVIIKNSKF